MFTHCADRTSIGRRRRGAVAVFTLVMLVVILGFAALTVDVGAMYNARADLQNAADSAAMAAASQLSNFSSGDPVELARNTAIDYVKKNKVLNKQVTLDPQNDVVFLRATYNAGTNKFTFTPSNSLPDAVHVNVRLAGDSPNGPLSLFFANIFGKTSTNVSASATAMMVPRDIAMVVDLSASHNDDSELRHYKETEINLWDLWNNLPGGYADAISTWDPAQIPANWKLPDGSAPQAAGPAWGAMKSLGFGTETVDSNYDPVNDPGLAYLPYQQKWVNATLSTYLTAQGYNASEVNAIMQNNGSDSSTVYPLRVATALGLAYWNSGIAAGRWSTHGQPAGNGNTTISSSEMVWAEQIMGRSVNESKTLWQDYISNYVMSTNTYMYDENSAFRYRFGIKTFVNYLLEDQPQNDETPEFATTPEYPMQSVRDGVQHMMDVITQLATDDQVSLEVYGTTAKHELDLSNDFQAVAAKVKTYQAGHYDRNTNMGGGIAKAIAELSSSRARSTTRKIIVLYTDGIANVDASGHSSVSGAESYALQQATIAASKGFKVYAVSVGSAPNIALMDQIAAVGKGVHYHAEGTIQQYSAQLDEIFNTLGAARSISLVE